MDVERDTSVTLAVADRHQLLNAAGEPVEAGREVGEVLLIKL